MTDKKIVGIGLNATRILLEKIAIRDLEIKQLKLQVQGMGKHIDELESQVRYLAQLEEEIEDLKLQRDGQSITIQQLEKEKCKFEAVAEHFEGEAQRLEKENKEWKEKVENLEGQVLQEISNTSTYKHELFETLMDNKFLKEDVFKLKFKLSSIKTLNKQEVEDKFKELLPSFIGLPNIDKLINYILNLIIPEIDKDKLKDIIMIWARDVADEDEGIKFKDIDKLVSKIIKKLGG